MGIDWENMYGDDANLADSYEDAVFDAMNDNRCTTYDDEEEDIHLMRTLYFEGRLAGCVSALLMADKDDDEICRFVSEKFSTDINKIKKITDVERRHLPFVFKGSVNNAYYVNKSWHLDSLVHFLVYQGKSDNEIYGIVMSRFPDENPEKVKEYVFYQTHFNMIVEENNKCYHKELCVRDFSAKPYAYTNVLRKVKRRSEEAFEIKGRLIGFVLGMLYLGFSDDAIRKYSEKAFDFGDGSLSDEILNSAKMLYGHDAELGMLNGIIDALHYMNIDNSTITDYIIRNVEVDESLIDMIENEELDYHLINYVNNRIGFIHEHNMSVRSDIRLKPYQDSETPKSESDAGLDFDSEFAEILEGPDLPF